MNSEMNDKANSKKMTREERLAKSLRDNLRRRKAATRKMSAPKPNDTSV
ncbi:hypothetical protein DES40_0650 [Litorimonas taeanensis]|uniref:Uncharacterized protein n=1 Tax=Litorimonas taeanensis TaxID=568099 RepID=A0A420WK70_9PROT|nr:hypothetical protein DES40_0650 [Litorimonas taeanensis]